jgi:hypothetical protein
MLDPEPCPRPNLDTNGDLDAWLEQFRVLFYVLKMSPQQIAEIDYGFDPDDPERWAVLSWEHSIRTHYPRVELPAFR